MKRYEILKMKEFMVVTMILITKLLTRTVIYIFIVYVYFYIKI